MTTTTFFGIPVEGDVTRNSSRKSAQRPAEELAPLLKDMLEMPGVEAVRWQQYTPYFNDGDPCVFRVGDPSVKMEGDDTSGDYEDGFMDSYGLEKGSVVRQALDALDLDAFEDVVLERFGDHATVTVTREKILVEFYEHD